MILKQITLAIAATLVTPAVLANIAPEGIPGVHKIVLSGTSRTDEFIESAVKEMLDPASIKTYRDNSLSSAFRHRAWFGYVKSMTPGVSPGTPILFVKRSTGDSFWGVDPVARASRIESLDFSACTLGGAAAGDADKVYDYFCPTKGLDPASSNFANPGINNGVVSDFGVSDVSPLLFKAPYNVEYYRTQLSDAEVAKLTIMPFMMQMMGLAVTDSVPLSTVISRADYGNMLMGNVADWSQIYDKDFDGTNDFDGSAVSGNNQVVVCRRSNGSGTQAAYNWYFNNFPCELAFGGSQAPSTMYADNASGISGGPGTSSIKPFIIDPTAGFTVVNNPTSGDVRNCLKNAQNNTDHLILSDDFRWYKIQFSNSTNPFKAIGVLEADSYGKESGWTFRNIYGAGSFSPFTQTASVGATGIAPSKANLLTGAWEFAVELTLQYRNANVINPQGDVITPPTGVKYGFVIDLMRRATYPPKFDSNSMRNAYAALPSGYNYFGYFPYDPAHSQHTALGNHPGNMCQPMMRSY
jgi:hypothetical protein